MRQIKNSDFVILMVILAGFVMAGCANPQGPRGDTGNPGVSGPKGDTGNVGSPGAPGNDGSTGPQGPKGDDGDSGPKGDTGATGPKGDQGDPGQDAPIATIIQLCPGVTAYPGTFVEIAFCIQGELYGVYSANGGFMTHFPPGNYSSNGIGSACNLTVHANCVVTPL